MTVTHTSFLSIRAFPVATSLSSSDNSFSVQFRQFCSVSVSELHLDPLTSGGDTGLRLRVDPDGVECLTDDPDTSQHLFIRQ